MSNAMLPSARLITFPVSHYCEKARWALERLNIPYIEERHAPLFHLMVTRRLGGSSVPVLISDRKVLTDSTEILQYLDTIAPNDAKLYPSAPELLKQVEELETLFNTKLGTSTRIWAYSYTLDIPQLSKRRFSYKVPFYEQVLLPVIFPLVSSKIRQKLHITPETTTAAYAQIIDIFAGVANLLKDGRRYLVGDRFSAADLTFAALCVATIRPPEYGDPALALSNLEQLPPKMAEEVRSFREMPAGEFALRLWRERAVKKV